MESLTKSFNNLGYVFLIGITLLTSGCNVNQNPEDEVFSFPGLSDSLSKYDSAIIILRDATGRPIDTLFHGPVTPTTTLVGLEAPHYNGGSVTIILEGYKDGKLVYLVEKSYTGKIVAETRPIVLPSTFIKLDALGLKMRVGDTLTLPKILFSPSNLAKKELVWSSSNPTNLSVDQFGMKALRTGTAFLKARLSVDTTKQDSVQVEIIADQILPIGKIDSIRLTPSDTLVVTEKGTSAQFIATVYPSTAPSEVTYGSLDSTIATVSSSGFVRGLKAAVTRIFARAQSDASISDTSWVKVLPPLKVDSIRFKKKVMEIFQQGASESLLVDVYPPMANPEVAFTLGMASIAIISEGKIQGVLEGESWIYAHSKEDPTKVDSIKVIVLPMTQVESVLVKPDTLRLYTNGESLSLTATIFPKSLQGRYIWRSSAQSVAIVDDVGKVSPIGQGYAYISAISRADSTKRDSSLVLVRKDTPKLFVGSDTVIAVGQSLKITPLAPQNYGVIIRFTCDMNGDGKYEDSAATLKDIQFTYSVAGDYSAKFYVRDSEGNDTTVVKSVRAVNGLVVQINSPKNGSITNQNPIAVNWSVDNIGRTDMDTLIDGPNTIVRNAKDAAGNIFSASISVTLDIKAPNKPIVKGPTGPVNSRNPTWNWTGGGEGNGSFRIRLDSPDMGMAIPTADTFYTVDSSLSESSHTLFVQERDVAGNWSISGQHTIRIDVTPPISPKVSVSPSPISTIGNPVWSWSTGGGGGSGLFRYKLGNSDFRSGTKDTTGTSITFPDFADGKYTLYVQERDSAGNWSGTDSAKVTVDRTPPSGPVVTVNVGSLTNNPQPTWSWNSGPGGIGSFRFKIDDANLEPVTASLATTFKPSTNLTENTHIFYIQERDSAGNWSPTKTSAIRVDVTKPPTPTVSLLQSSPTNSRHPTWNWTKAELGPGQFQFSLDNAANRDTVSTGFRPLIALPDGAHVLRVWERDSAGNLSDYGSATISIDSTGPNATAFDLIHPASPVASLTPTWKWTSGGGGATPGSFRYRLDGNSYSTFSGANSFTPIKQSEGEHTLFVQEQDPLGNLSQEASRKLILVETGFLGNPGFSEVGAHASAFTPQGVYHVASVSGGKGQVFKWQSNAWSMLGSGLTPFSTLTPWIRSLKFNGDIPIVVFTESDAEGNDQTLVKRYVNNKWELMGSPIQVGHWSYWIDMDLDASGNPFVAYDGEGSAIQVVGWVESEKKWKPVGTLDIGTTTDDGGGVAITISPTNIIYVGFSNWGSGAGKPVVKRFTGSFSNGSWTGSWAGYGAANFSDEIATYMSMDMAGNDPIIAFGDGSFTVMKYSNGSWQQVGSNPPATSGTGRGWLTYGVNGIPYIAINDAKEVQVKSLVDNQWVGLIGSQGSSASYSESIRLTISPEGVPFVSFGDANSGGNLSAKKCAFPSN